MAASMTSPQIQSDPLSYISFFKEKSKDKTAYLHKPPTISPKYGKPSKNPLPKTYIARVILYENSLQQNILDAEIKEINFKIRQRKSELYKKKFLFVDDQKRRQITHEKWETGYQRMKDAYISRYGTTYMPVKTPEPELVDPFFINARLMPVLNILWFYLDSLDEEGAMHEERCKKKQSSRPDANTEHMHDYERLMRTQNNLMYSHSIEDPRFRKLECSLIPPYFKNDGYLQLSPGYHPPREAKVRLKKWSSLKYRAITLPRFYTRSRNQVVTRESVRSRSSNKQKQQPQRDSTFPQIKPRLTTRFMLPKE